MTTAHSYVHFLTKTVFCSFVLILFTYTSTAQTRLDSIFNKVNPQKWSASVSKKVSRLEEKIISKSEKTLRKLQSQEEKVYEKMIHSKDSVLARTQLERIKHQYALMQDKLKNGVSPVSPNNIKDYIPHLDTLQSAFNFLDKAGLNDNVKEALSKIGSLNSRFQQAVDIRNFIRERRETLKQQLQNLGMLKELKQINKEVFYYSEQIKEYKEIINDPAKRERKAIELLTKTKLFKDFVRKNSMLASLFRLPGEDPNDPAYLASVVGLQTRVQVNTLVRQQMGGPNGLQQFQQSVAAAQSQFNEMKNKLMSAGQGSSDDIMPEGFKANNQKTKSFLKRLEYGTTLQTQRANYYFPTTTDFGLSLGYKLNDKSVIGIGASYKVGWGHSWNDVKINSQGVGLKSFIEWKLKGSLHIAGGYEQNFKTAFSDFEVLRNRNAWQKSGLIGISKDAPFGNKLIKRSKIQLLWDFLSYQQVPRTQPIVFRIGYIMK